MPVQKKASNEDQVLQNKKLLREAEDLSVLNSWFNSSAATVKQSSSDKSAQNNNVSAGAQVSSYNKDEEEDEDNFSADSDTGGLGSVRRSIASAETGADRQNLSANDNLRRQFLGKNVHIHSKPHRGQNSITPRPQHRHNSQQQSRKHRSNRDESDDEEGRTQATSSKRSKDQRRQGPGTTRKDTNEAEQISAGTTIASPTSTLGNTTNSGSQPERLTKKRKATAFLDEMLAKRGPRRAARRVDD